MVRARSRHEILPASLPPRGLSREEAAAYIGIGATKFDQMVDDGRMPQPKRIDGRKVWDRLRLDSAFAALPTDGGADDPSHGDVYDRVAL
jgi:excisionase family DNA binding protein